MRHGKTARKRFLWLSPKMPQTLSVGPTLGAIGALGVAILTFGPLGRLGHRAGGAYQARGTHVRPPAINPKSFPKHSQPSHLVSSL